MSKVSALVITYRHGELLEDCLNGALGQVVDFEYEVVVADDASDDGTPALVKRFQREHPQGHRLRHVRREKNGGLMKNYLTALDQSKGEFIAICEGDDFWLSNEKVAKQVAFLESRPDSFMCTHECFYREWPPVESLGLREASAIIARDARVYGFVHAMEDAALWVTDQKALKNRKRASMDRVRHKVLSLETLRDHQFFPASPSIMFRKALLTPVPEVFREADGHHHLSIWLAAMRGPILHDFDTMSMKRDCHVSFTRDHERKSRNFERSLDLSRNEKIRRFKGLISLAFDSSQVTLFEEMIGREEVKVKRRRSRSSA